MYLFLSKLHQQSHDPSPKDIQMKHLLQNTWDYNKFSGNKWSVFAWSWWIKRDKNFSMLNANAFWWTHTHQWWAHIQLYENVKCTTLEYTYISLYWSNATLASCSSLRSFSDGTAPSSKGGSYALLQGDLQLKW